APAHNLIPPFVYALPYKLAVRLVDFDGVVDNQVVGTLSGGAACNRGGEPESRVIVGKSRPTEPENAYRERFFSSRRTCPLETASRCSQMAPRCQLSTNGLVGSRTFQACLTKV